MTMKRYELRHMTKEQVINALAAPGMTTAQQIGERVGKAIARDVLADGQRRKWTGLDAQDADQMVLAGLEPDTVEWDLASAAARRAYEQVIRSA